MHGSTTFPLVFKLDLQFGTLLIWALPAHRVYIYIYNFTYTAQKTKFSIMDFFSKCDQIRSMENFIFLCNGTLYELPPSREIQTLLGFASLYFKVQKSVLRIERECRRKERLLQ